MKKIVLRSSIVAILITGIVAVLVWYFMMRRTIPEQAHVIPQNAFAVLTLNLRELALDISNEEHLFGDEQKESILEKELSPFTKAIKNNGASGIEETADVLCFAYQKNEAAYIGIALSLEDSAAFGNLMRTHLSREINLIPWTNSGMPLMRFDTTSAVIGWTEDAALFLYPISNHGIANVATECIQLLKQKPEQSLLVDDNFKEHQLTSFDIALWIQSKAVLEFTGGGDLIKQVLSGVRYYNYFSVFQEGEILIRSESELESGVVPNGLVETPFPCEPTDVIGFIRFYLDPKKDSLIENYVDSPPFNALPFSDEEATTLFNYLDGNCTMLLHDTISYPVTTVTYDYDENFNRTEKLDTVIHHATATSSTFRVKEPGKTRDLLTQLMGQDSIPLTNRGWIYKESGLESRMILTDELLTVTTFPNADGRSHPIPPAYTNFLFFFDLHKIFKSKEFPIPFVNTDAAFTLFEKHLLKLTSTLPVLIGNKSHSEICLKFANTKINGLIQVSDLTQRIYSLDHP